MLEIVPVKAFKDDYVWTLRNATHAAVVDPGEARPVLDYLAREKLQLEAILATHRIPTTSGAWPKRCRNAVFLPRAEASRGIPDPGAAVAEGDG